MTQPSDKLRILGAFLKLAFCIAGVTGWSEAVIAGEPTKKTRDAGTRYEAWFGANAGLGHLESQDAVKENTKQGYSLGVQGYLSGGNARTQFNLGLGWEQVRFVVGAKPENSEKEEDLEVRTQYAKAEMSFAHFISTRVALGPLLKVTFGTDTSFSPARELDNKRPNVLLGMQSFYYFGTPGRASSRLNLQLVTDVSIEQRQLYLASLGYDIGFEIINRPRVIVKEKIKIQRETTIKPVVEVQTVEVAKYEYRFVIDAGIINFTTGKHHLAPAYEAYLNELGRFLASRANDWDMIMITSHTDHRGSVALNKTLSLDRGNAVKGVLVAAKIEDTKIQMNSRESSAPVEQGSDQVALARNRRVELVVVGKKEVLRLKEDILRMQERHHLPSTCVGNTCR